MLDVQKLVAQFDCINGTLGHAASTKRYLSDLRGCFRDTAAYERELAQRNPLVYSVATIESAAGDGDLHYGLGTIFPGMVGDEYFMTKGHLHTWRDAAEVYVGLRGDGMMLLQDVNRNEAVAAVLRANSIVYVPGHTAHRTMNVGEEPLVYLGIYPARAGHDYQAIEKNNFQSVVLQRDGKPKLLQRNDA